MHAAARNGDVGVFNGLVAAGADVDQRDNLKRTPLHLAAWAGKADIVKLLIAHGCKVNLAAADDMNALHFAAQKGHTECVRHIINAGASREGAGDVWLLPSQQHSQQQLRHGCACCICGHAPCGSHSQRCDGMR